MEHFFSLDACLSPMWTDSKSSAWLSKSSKYFLYAPFIGYYAVLWKKQNTKGVEKRVVGRLPWMLSYNAAGNISISFCGQC